MTDSAAFGLAPCFEVSTTAEGLVRITQARTEPIPGEVALLLPPGAIPRLISELQRAITVPDSWPSPPAG